MPPLGNKVPAFCHAMGFMLQFSIVSLSLSQRKDLLKLRLSSSLVFVAHWKAESFPAHTVYI